MVRKVLTYLFLYFLSFNLYSQGATKQIQKADESFRSLAYAKAIELYDGILKKSKLTVDEDQYVKLKLAESYFLVKDYQNAELIYAGVLNSNPVLNSEDLKSYKRYAQVLSSNGKYSEAGLVYKKYTELQDQDKRGEEFAKLYSNLEALTRNASSYKIEYVGINSGDADFSPTYYNKGLVFVSGRNKKSGVKRIFSWDNSSFLDLYYLEDLKILGNTDPTASVSSSNDVTANDKTKVNSKLGTDYYTPQTPNDVATIAHQGSDLINGSKNYEENSIVDVKRFSKNINSKYHEGPCTFFHDGSKIIFTRNSQSAGPLNQKKDEIVRLQLFTAEKTKNDWGNIKELPFNGATYSCGHPSLSFDDSILFFVSDMPGGYGGTDIYMSRYINGTWSKPINLGGTINTRGNEMFPFIDEAGNLYFSSDGHPGLGDLDMFYVKMDLIKGQPKGKIRNLGAPLNSSKDDFGMLTDIERSIGYFSSNRKRGGSDDDIYKFTRLGQLYGCRELIVNVKDQFDKKPLENIKFEYEIIGNPKSKGSAITNSSGNVKLCLEADQEYNFYFSSKGYDDKKEFYSNIDASDYEPSKIDVMLKQTAPVLVAETPKTKKEREQLIQKRNTDNSKVFKGVITSGNGQPIQGVKVQFINKCTGEIQSLYTKKDGAYEFKRDLNCDYELVSFKEDFGTSKDLIEKAFVKKLFKKKFVPKYIGSLFDSKLYKIGDVIKLENIYYDSDDYKVKGNSAKELDKLVNILEKYPNMIIDIYSHTDTRGSSFDNLKLSQLRAKEVVSYLSKHGINKNRIRGVGKGETDPVNNCGDGVQCTEAEHRRNRRTEFKIIQIERK